MNTAANIPAAGLYMPPKSDPQEDYKALEPTYFETCLNKPLPPIPLLPNHPNSLTTPSSDDQPDTSKILSSKTGAHATVSTGITSGNGDEDYEDIPILSPPSSAIPIPPHLRLPPTATSGNRDDDYEDAEQYIPLPSSYIPLPPHLQLPLTTTKTPSDEQCITIPAPIHADDEGVYSIIPDIPSGYTEGEDIYEEMVHFLKEKLNPSQMDAIAIMLQRMKQSVHPEVTSPSANSATPSSPIHSPDYPPPTSDPPLDKYPGVEDYDGSEEDEPEPTHPSTRPAASKHESTQRLVRPPPIITELNPSMSKDLRAFGRFST